MREVSERALGANAASLIPTFHRVGEIPPLQILREAIVQGSVVAWC